MKVRKRLAPKSTLEAPGRPVRMWKLLTPAFVLERTLFGQSLSLDHVEEPSDMFGKAVADDVDDNSDSSSETYMQKENKRGQRKLQAHRARRRTRVHSQLFMSALADTVLEKLAVTTPHTNRYSQSREKLFSLLDLTERTMMELAEPRWDRKCASGEQSGCGEQMMAGLFDAFLAFSRMGARIIIILI